MIDAGLKVPRDPNWQDMTLNAFKTNMTTLKDAVELFRPLNEGPISLAPEAVEILSWPTTKSVVEAWKLGIETSMVEYLSAEQFLKLQDSIKDSLGVKGKHLFQPIRVAVIGTPQGTELKMLVPLMHKRTLLARANDVLEQIKKGQS